MKLKRTVYVMVNVLTVVVGFYGILSFVRVYQTTGGSGSDLGVSIPSPDPLGPTVLSLVMVTLIVVAARNIKLTVEASRGTDDR